MSGYSHSLSLRYADEPPGEYLRRVINQLSTPRRRALGPISRDQLLQAITKLEGRMISRGGDEEIGGSRYVWAVFFYGPGHWAVSLPNFRTSSRVGFLSLHDAEYLADKLRIPRPDAENLIPIFHRAMTQILEDLAT